MTACRENAWLLLVRLGFVGHHQRLRCKGRGTTLALLLHGGPPAGSAAGRLGRAAAARVSQRAGS